MLGNRTRPLAIAAACSALLCGASCELSSAETAADESDPPYQDLDGGNHWPGSGDSDNDSDEDDDFDPPSLEYCDDSGPDTAEGDAGWCADISWEGYQVAGSCPGLPPSGSIVQDEGCTLEIPGDLGAVIGETGSVDGPHVTTLHCAGLAEIGDFPSVTLTCIVEDASCEVELVGGTSGW